MPSKRPTPVQCILVVGVPGARRVRLFCEAARRVGFEHVEVVSYLDVIAGRCQAPPPGTLVRCESPGECATTTRAILRAGIAPLAAVGQSPLSAAEIDRLTCDRGEMLAPRQWYLGFREVLRRLSADWRDADSVWMTPPEAIIVSFDKLACLERWSRAGLPMPQRFAGLGGYGQIRDAIRDPHARLFVKLRYGYSAMGAVALEWRGKLTRAITSMEISRSRGQTRLFVSKRPQILTNEREIEWLIDTLAREAILVEEWLPKARIDGLPFDLRAVVIDGRVRHVVGRANDSPFTNLNLDARRIPRERIEPLLGPAWAEFESLCCQATEAICDQSLALDVLVRPGFRRFALLEANAFGDYLPGLTHDGQTTYEAALARFAHSGQEVAA